MLPSPKYCKTQTAVDKRAAFWIYFQVSDGSPALHLLKKVAYVNFQVHEVRSNLNLCFHIEFIKSGLT